MRVQSRASVPGGTSRRNGGEPYGGATLGSQSLSVAAAVIESAAARATRPIVGDIDEGGIVAAFGAAQKGHVSRERFTWR